MAATTKSKSVLFALSLAAISIAASTSFAYAPPRDRLAIQAQAGCYEVTFNFAETFGLQPGYQLHAPYFNKGLEWIEVDSNAGNAIALQHVLVLPEGGMKHWRQEWQYESRELFDFKGNNVWEKRYLGHGDVEGMWIQRVYQVDDGPRYECAAPWVHWGSKHYWECEAWSPLPRREFSKRSDYNVLARRNRHSIQKDGWVHEQDNLKLKVDGSNLTPIAKEKGEDTYRRVADDRCESARIWWKENKKVWNTIQGAWKKVFAENERLAFKKSADGKLLWEKLTDLGERARSADLDQTEIEREALALIRSYL